MNNTFSIPNLINYLRFCIKGFHICQLARSEKPPMRQLQLGMDLKVMPRSCKGHKYILCVIDEVTNYLITVCNIRPNQKR